MGPFVRLLLRHSPVQRLLPISRTPTDWLNVMSSFEHYSETGPKTPNIILEQSRIRHSFVKMICCTIAAAAAAEPHSRQLHYYSVLLALRPFGVHFNTFNSPNLSLNSIPSSVFTPNLIRWENRFALISCCMSRKDVICKQFPPLKVDHLHLTGCNDWIFILSLPCTGMFVYYFFLKEKPIVGKCRRRET